MSDLHPNSLASLPLLLWQTPPGLELILAQEGIAYETVHDSHPLAFRGGRFVLFDSQCVGAGVLHQLLTPEHVAIDIDQFRWDEPIDPFRALVDHQNARGQWKVRHWNLSERVGRYPKGWIRRKIIAGLREQVTAAGGVWIRLAPYPYPFRSVFNFRVDLDESVPEDYHRFAMARGSLGECCTHFVSTHAYESHSAVLDDLRCHDSQSHGHFHFVYRDAEANRRNLERADRILRKAGLDPVGFAAPHGRWNSGLDDALESLGYQYSSDFQLGYDDFPFFPWKGDRFSRILQLPVHPICEGLFLDAGVNDGRVIADYLCRVVEEKVSTGEPALVYGHPERRLGRMPEILIALSRVLETKSLVWRATMTELAQWWRWRADRKWLLLPREGNRHEIQFDEWDPAYPIAVEIHRGRFCCSIPMHGSRMVIDVDHLVYERQEEIPHPLVKPPTIERRPSSLKDAVRRAIDWETVTPLEELSSSSLSDRVKKGLRWWKFQRTGTGG